LSVRYGGICPGPADQPEGSDRRRVH
jgi:hypothetical protein